MNKPYKAGDLLKVIQPHTLGGDYIPSECFNLKINDIVLVINHEKLTEKEKESFGNKPEWIFGLQLFLFKNGRITPYDGYMLRQLQIYFELIKI